MGVEAELLDHDSPRVTRAELRCALSPTLPQWTPRSDFPAYARKTRKFREAFERLPLSRRFPIDRPEEMGDYDAVIVGSDEVWNRSEERRVGKECGSTCRSRRSP